MAVVGSSWTEVFSPGQLSGSCSKMYLAKLYPKGSKDMAIKAYVILMTRAIAHSKTRVIRAVQWEEQTIPVPPQNLLLHHRNIRQEGRRIGNRVTG